jgi:hypothetical protein
MLRLRHHAEPAGLAERQRQPAACQCGERLSASRGGDALAQSNSLFGFGYTNDCDWGASGVKMTGPYDYVAPSYWYVDKQNGGGIWIQHRD